MHIEVDPRDDYAVLHLRGEFDTYYCPLLQQEVESLTKAGVRNVVLNLRLVKFINSTALGAIIKASKALSAKQGKLAISRPSAFCRDIFDKVGLGRVVPIYDSDEAAGSALVGGEPSPGVAPTGDVLEDSTSVLFSPIDPARVEHYISADLRAGRAKNPVHGHDFGGNWNGIGRMAGLDAEGLRFTWNGGKTALTPFEMGQFLSLGTAFRFKFRLPLLQRGYCEAEAEVTEVEERPSGVKVSAVFSRIDDETRAAVEQYAQDLAYLKDELREATDGDD